MARSDASPTEVREAPRPIADPFSAMAPRFNLFFWGFAARFFKHLQLDPGAVERLRALEERGSVVYVMRYASRLDYFLFNTLFRRQGLRLSGFANGLGFWYYQPLLRALPLALRRLRARRLFFWRRERAVEHATGRDHVRSLVASGQSLFVFLRTARLSSWLLGRRHAVAAGERELDFLDEVVGCAWDQETPVFVVPLALFWRKGPRSGRRFLNLGYGETTRPTDLAKVTGFLLNYRSLSVKVGEPIDLQAFARERRAEGRTTLSRKIRRTLLIHLYREEKVVEGPTVRPRYRVQEQIFADPRFQAFLEQHAETAGISVEKASAQAQKMFWEIAASMNSTFLALLSTLAGWIFHRMFVGIEVTGLEKVARYTEQHPVVLVPSHRSYFDFLILSWLFYNNYMVPPHIAARENMGFGPFGFLFRRAGAFFLRRSFADPIYKEVFRRYVGYLVQEGFTQEFFIEGGRSRTGKSLAPRLGMLTWDVDAFLHTGRRDLFFVPIAITYERLVEEGSMVHELEGGSKTKESVLGLVRARRFLQKRFGTVFVNFGEPLSLADALGDRREALAAEGDEESDEKRVFIENLGNRIVERINWATVANATPVAACALLGAPRRGLFRHELTRRMQEIVDLLRIQDVRLTPALVQDEREDFKECIAFLVASGLIKSTDDPRGEIFYYEESSRRALDIYRNVIIHYLATPSLLASGLLRGERFGELHQDVTRWLDFLYREFFTPRGELVAAYVDGFIDYFQRFGLVDRHEERLLASDKGRPYFRFLANQTRGLIEAYYVSCSVVAAVDGRVGKKALAKRVKDQFERAELLGEVDRPESANAVIFENALDTLVRMDILQRAAAPGGRKGVRERTFEPGPNFDQLPALRERLAAMLAVQ